MPTSSCRKPGCEVEGRASAEHLEHLRREVVRAVNEERLAKLPVMMTVEETAEAIDTSVQEIRSLIDDGRLAVLDIGGCVLVVRDRNTAFLRRRLLRAPRGRIPMPDLLRQSGERTSVSD